jgi:hypothetical protein
MKNGIYNYRFSGNSVKYSLPYSIVGVGSFELNNLSIINGHHRSSVMVLQGSAPKLMHAHFLLTGTAAYQAAERNWEISLLFVEQNAPADRLAQQLKGQYRAVEVGDERYWVISAGAQTIQDGTPVAAHEIVSGEIVWVANS